MTPFTLDITEKQQRQDAGVTPVSNAETEEYWIDDIESLTEEERAEMAELEALLESRMQDVYRGNVVSTTAREIFEEVLGLPKS